MTAYNIDNILRDFQVLGDSGSGVYQVLKSQIRQYLKNLERSKTEGMIAAQGATELNAIDGGASDRWGVVRGAAVKSENGYYFWDASETDWTKVTGLGISVAEATNVAGTANTITADLVGDAEAGEVSVVFLVPAATNSAGAMTIAFDGGAAIGVKAADGTDPGAGDFVAGVGTFLYSFSSGAEWRQLVSSAASGTLDFQGVWNSGTTYTQGQFVTAADILYFLDAASSLNENPASGAPWVEVVDFAGVTTPGWQLELSGVSSIMAFEGDGAVIKAANPGDDKSFYIGADNAPSSNISTNIFGYGIGHATHPGEGGCAAVTAVIPGKGRPGHWNVETGATFRRYAFFGTRHTLTPDPNDINSIPVADAPVHVLVPVGVDGVPPFVAGLGANATYNPGLVIEADVSSGGQFSGQYLGGLDHLFWNIYATTQNSRQFFEKYDHQNERVELGAATGASTPVSILAYDYQTVYTAGKVSRNTGAVGCEFRGDGTGYFIADGVAPLNVNRLTDDGALANWFGQSILEGTISISGPTINYNSFHGTHWSQLSDLSKPDIPLGTVCETIDEMCDWWGVEFKDPITGEVITSEEYSDTIDLASKEGKRISIDVTRTVEVEREHIRYEEKPVLGDEREIDAFEHEEIDGKIVRKTVKKTVRDQIIEELPVLDEAGNPVMEEYREGRAVKIRPMVVRRPKMETVEIRETTSEQETKVFKIKAKVVRLENDRLVKFKVSDTPGSTRVYGTMVGHDRPDNDLDRDFVIGSLGAGFCRIDKDETVRGGDILESAGNGCARVLRVVDAEDTAAIGARAIGKVNAAIKVIEYDDGSYVVPMEHARG